MDVVSTPTVTFPMFSMLGKWVSNKWSQVSSQNHLFVNNGLRTIVSHAIDINIPLDGLNVTVDVALAYPEVLF